jgi:hypothetical protein
MNIANEQAIPYSSATLAQFNNATQSVSAVSWGAIFAGAASAAAVSLILLILGTGLGLSAISPWVQEGMSASNFGLTTIVWVVLTQLIAFGLGGYIAGRLRTKWTDTPVDEIYFRDTAHGFLTWAIASLATASLLTSVIGSIISGGVQVGGSIAGNVASTAMTASAAGVAAGVANSDSADVNNGSTNYLIDSLFRPDANQVGAASLTQGATQAATDASTQVPAQENGSQTQNSAAPLSEVARIFMQTPRAATLPADDVRYLGQMIAARTGVSQQAAEKRVTDTREALDSARKASTYGALWLFISLLIGAFVASLAATYGGHQRDA